MTDIVQRLRGLVYQEEWLGEAADEIERLRAALKPFAETLRHIPGMNYRDDVSLSSEWVGAGKLTVGDLRRAATAIDQQGPQPTEK